MAANHIDLNYSIVAFVDILGFSNMVKSDCESPNGTFKYFEILKTLNAQTREIGECDITQFSDSVIFSLELSKENYLKIIKLLSDYQLELLYHNIICRGAIAFGKHYKENDFMFSHALIEAYNLELKDAIYPRIILSENLFDFFNPTVKDLGNVLKEKDGFYFIDYFAAADKERCLTCLTEFNKNTRHLSLPIKEKYYWLNRYWEYKFDDTLPFSVSLFSK